MVTGLLVLAIIVTASWFAAQWIVDKFNGKN